MTGVTRSKSLHETVSSISQAALQSFRRPRGFRPTLSLSFRHSRQHRHYRWCTRRFLSTILAFLALTGLVSYQQIQNEDPIVTSLLPDWIVDDHSDEIDLMGVRANKDDGVLDERPFVEHEIQALVEEDEDEFIEEEHAWQNVEQAFEKADAKRQTQWWNSHGIVHVVHTRFLQNRPRLQDFTKARLEQFKAFTLPSIKQQTNDEFLWVIWSDTSLTEDTETQIKEMLHGMTNVVVLGYKKERHSIQSAWFQNTFDQSYIVTGSYRLIMSFHQAAQNHTVVDTFLDAEDALSLNFVGDVQKEASEALAQRGTFRLWCPSHHLSWGYSSPPWHHQMQKDVYRMALLKESEEEVVNPDITIPSLERGFFTVKRAVDSCLSGAGTSVGYSAKSKPERDFPVLLKVQNTATSWHSMIMHCDTYGESNCLGFIENQRFIQPDQSEKRFPEVAMAKAVLLRSKTITAAESKGITQVFPKRPKPSPEAVFAAQQKMWQLMDPVFGIDPDSIHSWRQGFESNLDKVVMDMMTICLPSNNCSPKNKAALKELLSTVGLRKVNNETAVMMNGRRSLNAQIQE